jgi:hypothetical protein
MEHVGVGELGGQGATGDVARQGGEGAVLGIGGEIRVREVGVEHSRQLGVGRPQLPQEPLARADNLGE